MGTGIWNQLRRQINTALGQTHRAGASALLDAALSQLSGRGSGGGGRGSGHDNM